MEKQHKQVTGKRRIKKAYIPVGILIAMVLAATVYWYINYMSFITTDDALIDNDNVALGPKIMGRIVSLYAEEGDTVTGGQLLIELDSTDICAQKKQALATVQQAIANKEQAVRKLAADRENIKVLEINADKSTSDLDRAKRQLDADVITKEQYDNINKNFETSFAQLHAARAQLKVSESQIISADAAVENAKAQVNILNAQLHNTKLFSPFNGIVAKRWLIPGDIATPGQAILTINNYQHLWISVYIEETKLNAIHIGQEAEFTLDAFNGPKFYGKVIQIGNSTASRFSLIPPNNASGNFTKITQRVQLKVSIDRVDKGSLNDYPLLAGMSAIMKIRKRQ
jgi:membrane fusion protein (multidrug efflux system)